MRGTCGSQDHPIQAILGQPDHGSPAGGTPVCKCAQPRSAKSDSADLQTKNRPFWGKQNSMTLNLQFVSVDGYIPCLLLLHHPAPSLYCLRSKNTPLCPSVGVMLCVPSKGEEEAMDRSQEKQMPDRTCWTQFYPLAAWWWSHLAYGSLVFLSLGWWECQVKLDLEFKS